MTERDIADVLREAGYEVTESVAIPDVVQGCDRCGRDVEAINGCCIRCAAKTAPTHWPATAMEEAGEP